jgi:UDP-glucose 4-epimerase
LKKIVITGYDGFVGSHLVDTLLQKYNMVGISNTSATKQNTLQIRKDIRNITAKDLPKNIYCIIHLAALTDVVYCHDHPVDCYDVNVKGTQNVLEIARKIDSKFIFASTSHVYGIPQKLPIKEDHPKNPASIYSASKLAGEIIAESYARSYGMDVTILRLFSVYGPKSPSHLVTSRIISQLDNNVIRLGNVSPKRDFVYIKDVVNAIELVLKKSTGLNIYNVGTGKSHSVLDLCNLLRKIAHKNTPVRSVKSYSRKSDVDEIVSNPSKIKKLGWKPQVELSVGLKMTFDWFVSQKYP